MMAVVLMRLGVLGGLLAFWSWAAGAAPRGIVPTPAATWEAAGRLWESGRLTQALGESLAVYGAGLGLAAVVGIAVGVLMGAFRPLGRALDVFVDALAATPRVAFIPLIILLLGLGAEAKIFIVFLGAVMPVILNAYAGVRNADPELIEMARSTGAGRWRIFAHVVLPGATPFLATGLRLAAAVGLINTVVAELYTAAQGLGGLLALYGNSFRMAEYFVILLTFSLIGVVVTEGLRLAERRLGRWRGE
ncbi:ABC transporter permease [Neomegalonema sp.]|uniref:ABC transporter permease n=1 Tax=Neomegalonema sp. TaxID=2039713 RepID=UPI00262D795C|nr:ABC transporter permease [Neomegalonema sp.]MDD2869265.1 ABC transporter permease [Neomegalonema sp.]